MQPTRLIDHVVLVDEHDREIGLLPKLQAHREGRLHRALSILIFNTDGDLLMQQRAVDKYHSGGLWSNTCCTHPLPGEPVAIAAQRRLFEEMGLDCTVERIGGLVYRSDLPGDLVEHEYDHLFVGRHDGDPSPNGKEVADWRWMPWNELRQDVLSRPDSYTCWLGFVLDEATRILDLA